MKRDVTSEWRHKGTPWGAVQHATEIAPGIVNISTARHGGFWLSPGRMLDFWFSEEETFAGKPWYEEDCDWALVVIGFAKHFERQSIAYAVRSIQSGNREYPKWWLENDPRGRAIVLTADKYFEERKSMWQRGSMSTTNRRGIWWVSFGKGGEFKERRSVEMPYPEKLWYTTEELDQIEQENDPGWNCQTCGDSECPGCRPHPQGLTCFV